MQYAAQKQTKAAFYSKAEVKEMFAPGDWRMVVFGEFEATLTSDSRPFPCIFGVRGLQADQLRYLFLDQTNPTVLGAALSEYIGSARGLGPNTSLVVFTRPGPVRSLDSYRQTFWSILNELALIDGKPWPSQVPTNLSDPMWEFCFAGEPIFVVCSTPAHVLRQSRRSTSFMLTFQPRWVFEGILSTRKSADAVSAKVRARLVPYDAVPPSPDLGYYGDPSSREYRQYFLDDENREAECPFRRLGVQGSKKEVA